MVFKFASFLLKFLRVKLVYQIGYMKIRIIDGMSLFVHLECEYIGSNGLKWAYSVV